MSWVTPASLWQRANSCNLGPTFSPLPVRFSHFAANDGVATEYEYGIFISHMFDVLASDFPYLT